MKIMKNVNDILKEVTKGDTNINKKDGSWGMCTAGIDTKSHEHMIECHADTAEEAEAMRDTLLALVFEHNIKIPKETTRPVTVFKWERSEGETYYEKVELGKGNFHQFGVDYTDCEYGTGAFSTAIVEMPDGVVVNVPVNLIKFEDGQDGK